MGLLDQVFGPDYLGLAKKKQKPVVVVPVAPDRPASTAAKAAATPQGEVLPTPVAIARPSPQFISMPDLGALSPPLSPEDLKTAAEYLGILSKEEPNKEWPTFNIDDLKAQMETVKPTDLPLDLRGLAGLADTLYGTKMYGVTPNLRGERLDELQKIKALNSDSQALQQVKGQARLAEYKEKLNRSGVMSPRETAQAMSSLAKALRGGNSNDYSRLRLALGIEEKNQKTQENANEEDRRIEGDLRKVEASLAKDWQDDKLVQRYQIAQQKTSNIRTLLTDPIKDGTNDYTVTIEYIRNLDPDSTVMFNEAQSFAQSGGAINQIMNTPNRWINGGRLSPPQRQAIMRTLDQFEAIWADKYAKARAGKALEAANQGIDPKKVIGPVDKRVNTSKGRFRYSPVGGGEDYIIDGDKINKFKDWAKSKNIKLIERGRED